MLCVSSNVHPKRNVFCARPNKCRVTSGPWLLSSTHLEQSTCWSLFLCFVSRVFLCWTWIICGNVCVFLCWMKLYYYTCRWLDEVLRFAQIATIWVYVGTRRSILCVTHQMNHKRRNYSAVPYEMMNYNWYQQVLGQYKAILSGTCLTHRQATEYRATQLVSSIKFKLSHAIINKIFILIICSPKSELNALDGCLGDHCPVSTVLQLSWIKLLCKLFFTCLYRVRIKDRNQMINVDSPAPPRWS